MKFKTLFCGLFNGSAMALLLFSSQVNAQNVNISIETRSNALVLQADDKKNLNTIYFGKKLSSSAEYEMIPSQYKQSSEYTSVLNSAYTASGSKSLLEPAVTVTHVDGNNSLDLRYVSHSVKKESDDVSLLSIILKDPVYDFQVTLYYKSYFKDDVVEQWSVIKHKEKGNVLLQKYASANLYLKAGSFYLNQYHGDWAKEMQPEESKITHGIKTLDTKLGTRANLFQPSVFMISMDKPATEDEGTVLYGALEYSGNFKTDIELDYLNNLKIISGINNYASPYLLKPNEEFVTPAFLYTLSSTGKGDASRNMHNWARKYKVWMAKVNVLRC
jgi:alpha-galactosidase